MKQTTAIGLVTGLVILACVLGFGTWWACKELDVLRASRPAQRLSRTLHNTWRKWERWAAGP